MGDLLTRGIERVYPSKEALEKELALGRKLKIYFGIDPTGPSLHLGHASVLLKLRDFQSSGHEVIILLGDFTAMIGDPTDKNAARVGLTRDQVLAHAKPYQRQIGKFLDPKLTTFARNSQWLKKLNLGQVLELASEFTVAQMLERDMFQARIKNGAPVYLHEFLYPLLQGYDSVALDVDAEIGANDQTFNMLVGREMQKRRGKEKFVIATKLLVDPTGKKMGKTEGNMVMLTDSPDEMYGKIMSWPDALLPLGYEILTRLPLPRGEDPKNEKMRLAREVVRTCSSAPKARAAERKFIETFQKKNPQDFIEISATRGERLIEALLRANLVNSKSELQRLARAGAIHDLPPAGGAGTAMTDILLPITKPLALRVGKRGFVKIEPK